VAQALVPAVPDFSPASERLSSVFYCLVLKARC
jgi:hypothetical protein